MLHSFLPKFLPSDFSLEEALDPITDGMTQCHFDLLLFRVEIYNLKNLFNATNTMGPLVFVSGV